MLGLYRVDDDRLEAMVQVAREARQRGWWQKFVDVPDGVPAYVGLEAAATSIDVYMSLIVPALLQTPDYARAVIGAVRPDLPREEIDRRVELRVRRQGLLDQERPPLMQVLLDDAVLARPVGGAAVMAAQRRRLLEDAERAAITLQLLPVAAGAHAGMDGPFTIFGFPAAAERDVVALDSAADALYLESPEDVARYRRVFELLLPAAELAAADAAQEGGPFDGGELQHRSAALLLGVAQRDPVPHERHLDAAVGGAEGALAPLDARLVLHLSPSPLPSAPAPAAGRRSRMLSPTASGDATQSSPSDNPAATWAD
jgi:hypothetical protein